MFQNRQQDEFVSTLVGLVLDKGEDIPDSDRYVYEVVIDLHQYLFKRMLVQKGISKLPDEFLPRIEPILTVVRQFIAVESEEDYLLFDLIQSLEGILQLVIIRQYQRDRLNKEPPS